jgi:hypothetical protein
VAFNFKFSSSRVLTLLSKVTLAEKKELVISATYPGKLIIKLMGLRISWLTNLKVEEVSNFTSLIIRQMQKITAKTTLEGFIAGIANIASLLI